jgi:NitT/TauT family transport system ATP-binding protein
MGALRSISMGSPPATPRPEENATAVSIDGVSKVYGPQGSHTFALDRISLEVKTGEFVCVVGASGCGKTTLLNLITGLDKADLGSIKVNGRAALLFQEAALFPWLTAARNVELPLRLSGVGRKERRERAEELLKMVHLEGFAEKRPHELSGGMRQRVALARAFAQDANILLMDEPFGALDAITRDLMHEELERICTEQRATVLFVTHNVREAVRLGDRVLVLSSRPGRVMHEYDVPIERPRSMESPEVAEIASKVLKSLREEVRRHAGQAAE